MNECEICGGGLVHGEEGLCSGCEETQAVRHEDEHRDADWRDGIEAHCEN